MKLKKHEKYELSQLQSLSLDQKEKVSLRRIKEWYQSFDKYEIFNKKTMKIKYLASLDIPNLKRNEEIVRVERGACYVAFSGGKDSSVLADLCAKVCEKYGYKLILVFSNTGLEFPEIQINARNFVEYLKSKYSCEIKLKIVNPQKKFIEIIKEFGYPVISKQISKSIRLAKKYDEKTGANRSYYKKVKGLLLDNDGKKSVFNCEKYSFLMDADFDVSEQCCDFLKKKPMKLFEKENGLVPLIGTLAEESMLRRMAWEKTGCNSFDSKEKTSKPLSFWTEQDVLKYIVKNKMPIASVYGKVVFDDKKQKYITTGEKRTGCIFCAFGACKKNDNRFLRLKKTHKKQYDFCIKGGEYDSKGKWKPNKEGLGLWKVLDSIGVEY